MDTDRGAQYLDKAAAKRPRLVAPRELRQTVERLWDEGLPKGYATGWRTVDDYYTILPGLLTVITGWPGSGKSEFLDAMLVNLARQSWKLAMFSPENSPLEFHATKLMEKLAGLPFGAGPSRRIDREDLPEHLDDISESFVLMEGRSGGVSVPAVLQAAGEWLDQFPENPRGLVIDPWNELEHERPSSLSETEYISQTLSVVRQWGRQTKTHVWIVAHPQKMRRDDGGGLPLVKPDMISGSQHWWNKTDFAITVHLPDGHNSQDVQIHVLKCRFKHLGKVGSATLIYDRVTGRYSEKPVEWASVSRAI